MGFKDFMRRKLRSFLQIENPQQNLITLSNLTDFETECYINRVWSWGDKEALEQLYKQLTNMSTRLNFWSASPSLGMVKRHTGVPELIVDVLTNIVVGDLNTIGVENRMAEWEQILDKLNIEDLLSDAVKEVLVVGDGAFRISINKAISEYPIVDFLSGEDVEFHYTKSIVSEVVFKSTITFGHKRYQFEETYGYGYIISKLYDGDNEISLTTLPQTKDIQECIEFDKSVMMAVPFIVFKSSRFKGRGKSIYAGKHDSFDSLDETWSQWMMAVRHGGAKEYIPENLLPRDPDTGMVLKPNPFDHSFIQVESQLIEGQASKIEVEQPSIPTSNYLETYITALDLALQGIISPSTLGIDTKKLDNGEAQREKEKTTLYTRNKIVSTLQEVLPILVNMILGTYDISNGTKPNKYDVEVPFGEYANPSFESQVETVAKAKGSNIMSIETAVDELYGDTKNEEWKAEEVKRIKEQNGVMTTDEESVGMSLSADMTKAVNEV